MCAILKELSYRSLKDMKGHIRTHLMVSPNEHVCQIWLRTDQGCDLESVPKFADWQTHRLTDSQTHGKVKPISPTLIESGLKNYTVITVSMGSKSVFNHAYKVTAITYSLLPPHQNVATFLALMSTESASHCKYFQNPAKQTNLSDHEPWITLQVTVHNLQTYSFVL